MGVDFLKNKSEFENRAKKIIFTGAIDEFFGYELGALEYRSLKFEHEILDMPNFQGVAVMNFTDKTPFTRIIEHKHFEFKGGEKTIITREFPRDWHRGDEPFYPINDAKNNALYERYLELAKTTNVAFKGRLGEYRYYDMQDVIKSALNFAKSELGENF